jgi:tetratricopeptide (TPR) repeat protein
MARLAMWALLGALLAAPAARASDPAAADSWVATARAAAHDARHAEAATAFEQAVARDSARRREWLVEWADQLSWAGRAGEAIPLYREALAAQPPPADPRRVRRQLALALAWNGELEASRDAWQALVDEDPGDLEARLGLAQSLSWLDLQGPAKQGYEDVLRHDAGNPEAQRSLGRIQSWRGRQRDARRRLVAFLTTHPEDAEASYLLAQAQDWMGRPDLAQRTLRAHLARHPDDARSRELLERIELGLRPVARLGQAESHQSDDLRIGVTRLEQDFHANEGLTTFGPRFELHRYDPDDDPVDRIHVQRPGFYARHRFNDAFELTGDLFVDLIDVDGGGRGDDAIVTYDAWATFWPNDLLRFDVGSSRTTFDNTDSLAQNITAVFGAASMDVLPDEKTRLTTRLNWGDYSDGNERGWWQLEAARRVHNHPDLWAGLRYTGLDFTRELDNGYFNPDWYHANELTLEGGDEIAPGLLLGLSGSAGVEVVEPDGVQFVWSAGARVVYQLAERVSLDVHYRYFSSEQASSGGFARGTGGAALRFAW